MTDYKKKEVQIETHTIETHQVEVVKEIAQEFVREVMVPLITRVEVVHAGGAQQTQLTHLQCALPVASMCGSRSSSSSRSSS